MFLLDFMRHFNLLWDSFKSYELPSSTCQVTFWGRHYSCCSNLNGLRLLAYRSFSSGFLSTLSLIFAFDLNTVALTLVTSLLLCQKKTNDYSNLWQEELILTYNSRSRVPNTGAFVTVGGLRDCIHSYSRREWTRSGKARNSQNLPSVTNFP